MGHFSGLLLELTLNYWATKEASPVQWVMKCSSKAHFTLHAVVMLIIRSWVVHLILIPCCLFHFWLNLASTLCVPIGIAYSLIPRPVRKIGDKGLVSTICAYMSLISWHSGNSGYYCVTSMCHDILYVYIAVYLIVDFDNVYLCARPGFCHIVCLPATLEL